VTPLPVILIHEC